MVYFCSSRCRLWSFIFNKPPYRISIVVYRSINEQLYDILPTLLQGQSYTIPKNRSPRKFLAKYSRKIIQMYREYISIEISKTESMQQEHTILNMCMISLVNTLTLKIQMEIESDNIKLTFLPWRTLTCSSESCDFLCTHLSLKHDRRRYFKT